MYAYQWQCMCSIWLCLISVMQNVINYTMELFAKEMKDEKPAKQSPAANIEELKGEDSMACAMAL